MCDCEGPASNGTQYHCYTCSGPVELSPSEKLKAGDGRRFPLHESLDDLGLRLAALRLFFLNELLSDSAGLEALLFCLKEPQNEERQEIPLNDCPTPLNERLRARVAGRIAPGLSSGVTCGRANGAWLKLSVS